MAAERIEEETKELPFQTPITLRRKHQIAVNNEWGFKVGQRDEKGITIILDRPGKWEVTLSTEPKNRKRRKNRQTEEIFTYNFHLHQGEKAFFGEYSLTVQEIAEESTIIVGSPDKIFTEELPTLKIMKHFLEKRRGGIFEL